MPTLDEDILALLVGATQAHLDLVAHYQAGRYVETAEKAVKMACMLCSYLEHGQILPEYQALYAETRKIVDS
jgi:hypothetical protein